MKCNPVFLSAVLCVFSLLALGGCLYEEGHLNENKIQLEQTRFSEQYEISALDESHLRVISDHYARRGDGPLYLSILYDPKSSVNTAMHASHSLTSLTGMMRRQGIQTINSNIIPAQGTGDEAQVIISYTAYDALAPQNCGMLNGFDSRMVDVDRDYRLGCTIDTVLARQIARPKDLAGRAGADPDTDGRRAGNIVETYRTGVPNEPLGGESAAN